MRRKLAIAAVLGLALTIGAAGTGSATRTIRIPSRISIDSKGLRFSGRVTTGKPGCFAERNVVLYKVVRGGPDQTVGRARTDDRGEWSVTVSGWAGVSLTDFYAAVRRSSEGTAGTIYVCLPARSRTIKPGR